MIDPTFQNIDRLFVQSFRAGENDPTRNSLEIKDFNALIDNKTFFDQPVKNKRIVWKTCQNVKKQLIYNSKFIRLLIPPKLSLTHSHWFIKTIEYKNSPQN